MADRSGRVVNEDRAEREGGEAFLAGRDRESVPAGYRVARGLAKAWQRGWDVACRERQAVSLAEIKTPEPEIRHGEPPLTGLRWPEGKPLPTQYVRRQPIPCPSCLLVLLPRSRSQAVVVTSMPLKRGVAWLRCRADGCGHTFKLEVVDG